MDSYHSSDEAVAWKSKGLVSECYLVLRTSTDSVRITLIIPYLMSDRERMSEQNLPLLYTKLGKYLIEKSICNERHNMLVVNN